MYKFNPSWQPCVLWTSVFEPKAWFLGSLKILFMPICDFKTIKRSLAAFLFVATFSIFIPANADQNRTTELKEFRSIFQKFNKAKKSKNHKSMILFGERLTSFSLKYFRNDDFIIPIMRNYADALVATSNYTRAVEIFRKIIDISEKKIPKDWKTIALTHATLIPALRLAGRFEEADRLQKSLKTILKRISSKTPGDQKWGELMVLKIFQTNIMRRIMKTVN